MPLPGTAKQGSSDDMSPWGQSELLRTETFSDEERIARAHAAAMTVCTQVSSTEDAREVLEYLGIMDDLREGRGLPARAA